jgi:hypothetical protein
MPDGLLPAAELLLARLESGALILRVVHMLPPVSTPSLIAAGMAQFEHLVRDDVERTELNGAV